MSVENAKVDIGEVDRSAPDCRVGKCETSKYGQPKVIVKRRTFKFKQRKFFNNLFRVLQCENLCTILQHLFVYGNRSKD